MAAQNLLQIVQEVRGRMGQPIPTSVMASTDAGVIQCRGLLNEFLEDLVMRKRWQVNTREATFVSVATESQGTLDSIATYGFEGMVPGTFFNRTTKLPVTGSLREAEWAALKALGVSGPFPEFRLRQNTLLMLPVPTAGETYAFEYFSSYFVQNLAGVASKYWTADTDICVLDDALPKAYLKWAWRKEKGFDYGEDFRKYEAMLAAKSLREAAPRPINMEGGGVPSIGPGVVIPPGSWSLP